MASTVVWNQHLPHTAVCCPGEGVQDKYNTAAPLYSSFLADKLDMRKVYQQYVLYSHDFGLGMSALLLHFLCFGRPSKPCPAVLAIVGEYPFDEIFNNVSR